MRKIDHIKKWEDHWLVKQSLDRGGQGTTTIVESKENNNHGVLKLIHKNRESLRQARARMVIEIENLIAIKDAGGNVPSVLDDNSEMLKNPTVPLYFVMELIQGENLRKYVSSRNKLSLSESLILIKSLISTLNLAHSLGIIHRDIKPENIVVSHVNDVSASVLLDFGISFNSSAPGNATRPLETIVGTGGVRL